MLSGKHRQFSRGALAPMVLLVLLVLLVFLAGIFFVSVDGMLPVTQVEATGGVPATTLLGLFLVAGLLILALAGYMVLIQRLARRNNLQHAARMSTLVGNIPGGVLRCQDDSMWTLLEYSKGFIEMTGYTQEEITRLFQQQLMLFIYAPDRQRTMEEAEKGRRQCGGAVIMEYRLMRKDGSLLWVADHSQLVEENGQAYWCAVLLDVSAKRGAQERRRVEEERYRILFEMSDAILYEYDMRSRIMHTTRQFFEKFDYPAPESLSPHHPVGTEIIHPDDAATFAALHQALQEGVASTEAIVRIRRCDGEWLWCHVQQTALHDADMNCIKALGKITNVDAETRALHKLREDVQRDPFTGLYNKVATTALVNDALDGIGDQGISDMLCALCIVDVDNFKRVNDCLGHDMGDTVLKKLSASLAQLFRSSDIVGRVGGDEFVIFMRDVKNVQTIEYKMCQVRDAFRHSFEYAGCDQIRISASVGIALSPADGQCFSTLYPKADKALYRSKKTKDAQTFYDAVLDA